MKPISISQLRAMYAQKGYPLFEKGNYNLNIFGIRSKNRIAGYFDDIIGLLYKINGIWTLQQYEGTVDCGAFYMINPMNVEGAAFMVEGFYRGLWQLGSFHNTHALIQVKPVQYYRDNDRDNIIELDPTTIKEGLIGLFAHEHFQAVNDAQLIHNSSAACWVLKKRSDYYEKMKIISLSSQIYGNSFSCALFNEEDFE